MSTLSERDGLEDVFLSIHTNKNKLYTIKDISSLFISKKKYFLANKLIKQANYGIKKSKLAHFISIYIKKKKNLSK